MSEIETQIDVTPKASEPKQDRSAQASKVENLAAQAKFEVDDSATLFKPAKKKRGPYKKAEKQGPGPKVASGPTLGVNETGQAQPIQNDQPQTREMLKPLFQIVSTRFVAVVGPEAEFRPEEVDALATVYGQLCDKYAPAILGQWSLEITAAGTTLAIFWPRIMMYEVKQRKLKAEYEARVRAQQQGQPPPPQQAAPQAPPQAPPANSTPSSFQAETYPSPFQQGMMNN